MYICDDCGNRVHAKPDDPIHVISRGKFCTTCFRSLHQRESREGARTERATALLEVEALDEVPAKSVGKSAALKARWANMSPEEKAARVAKMRAGLTRQETA